jgi:hypothetical protein
MPGYTWVGCARNAMQFLLKLQAFGQKLIKN